jgi:hypothetical protein
MRNLNKEIKNIEGRTKAGLWQAALLVRHQSQELTPVDTGNLKGSAFTDSYDTPKGPGAVIGYTATYAVYVHEIDNNYRVGQWKFLEMALRMLKKKILHTIKSYARIQ